jgi:hypothetical protein
VTFCLDMPNVREHLPDLLKHVMVAAPRKVDGRLMYEILGAQLCLEDPIDSLPGEIGVPFDVENAVRSTLEVLAGTSKIGERLRHQFSDAEKLFSPGGDPRSLGALCMAIDPMYDRMVPEVTMTETIACQFIYRDQAMHIQVFFRSIDVLNELPAQLFLWSQVLGSMTDVVLAPELGTVTFHIGALGLRSSDTTIVTDYLKAPKVPSERPIGLPTGLAGESWEAIVQRARWLLSLREIDAAVTSSEHWYLEQLLPLSVSAS